MRILFLVIWHLTRWLLNFCVGCLSIGVFCGPCAAATLNPSNITGAAVLGGAVFVGVPFGLMYATMIHGDVEAPEF